MTARLLQKLLLSARLPETALGKTMNQIEFLEFLLAGNFSLMVSVHATDIGATATSILASDGPHKITKASP